MIWGDLFPEAPSHVASATISRCGRYRYDLRRRWARGPLFACIGLNPSTADASEDDPTIRRVVGFAKREGCGGIVMLNLFALRATDPEALVELSEAARWHRKTGARYSTIRPDAVGPDNGHAIAAALVEVERSVGLVVAAWGSTHARLIADRVDVVRSLCGALPLMCFGTTKDGAPRHPLYLRADAPLVRWSPR